MSTLLSHPAGQEEESEEESEESEAEVTVEEAEVTAEEAEVTVEEAEVTAEPVTQEVVQNVRDILSTETNVTVDNSELEERVKFLEARIEELIKVLINMGRSINIPDIFSI